MAKQKLTTMNISMPVATRKWIEKRMKAEGCANASEYIRRLVQSDLLATQHLRRLIEEGEKSGPAKPMTEKDWKQLEEDALRAARSRRRKSA